MQITKEQVKSWHACTDGFRWFLDKFPQGGAYADVHGALIADKRFDDARWLVDKMYRTHLDKAEFIQAETAATDKMVGELTSSGDDARIGSSGDDARIGSSGYNAQIGSSGDDARIGSSGDDAQIGSSGDDAQIGSSGYNAQIGSSGDDARIGSSGYNARITASGKNSVVACAGSIERIVLGENGCTSVPWHDGKRIRIAVAYVGENGIEANTPYYVNDEGQFVKVEE
ncbi:hypothetical protein JF078_003724 [Salmonella enterica]|uniref:Uncharacterized protein n=1 Tax=Salmonella enterica TaxID=28901 RepID=A0A5Z8MBC2_SALER|nr:hypothetical protein [Salmonella enterica]EDX2043244.1 hypothetical protein [Salmonella enterica subsp. houtenae serovar 50:z4,z23:-]HCM2777295.1 hypothetical protein [Salmonella enterica subsp. enterica serovar Sandiego]EAO3206701.1 hypothetical protein [Salmonella enterica]EAO4176141.1 hypothetical protein [Salmonella enterica]